VGAELSVGIQRAGLSGGQCRWGGEERRREAEGREKGVGKGELVCQRLSVQWGNRLGGREKVGQLEMNHIKIRGGGRWGGCGGGGGREERRGGGGEGVLLMSNRFYGQSGTRSAGGKGSWCWDSIGEAVGGREGVQIQGEGEQVVGRLELRKKV